MQLNGAPALLPVDEGGEFKQGTVGEGNEKYRVATYGRIVNYPRQSIINDDLRAFDRLITGFAGSARCLENRTVYSQITHQRQPVRWRGAVPFQPGQHRCSDQPPRWVLAVPPCVRKKAWRTRTQHYPGVSIGTCSTGAGGIPVHQ